MIPLREAKASQSRAARLRAVFWAFLTIALFAMMIAMIAWPAALAGKLLWLAFAVTPMAIAVRSRARASKATGDANEALDRAWLAAAEDATSQAKKGVTVAELAARLKIDAVKAEKLLTQLAVHDRTRIDVGDDAEVRYSMTPEIDTSKVRVASSEDAFLALEEAEAASERREQQRLQDEDEAKKLATAPFGRGPAR